MAAVSQQIDTHIQIVTPENISFQYRVAGPFQRLPAYLIDVLLQWLVIVVASVLIMTVFGVAGLPGLGVGLSAVVWFVLSWFYGGLFESLWNGQTPGKRLLRLRVLSTDGQPINALQAVLRNILRAVDMLPPVFYFVGFASAFWNDRFARLGDLACGTMVIVEEPRYGYGAIKIVEPEALSLAAELPMRINISRTLALALSAYVSRRRQLPWSRRVQIARHIGEPLRQKFGLSWGTSYDLLLCAVYHKVFFSEFADELGQRNDAVGSSPFASVAI